MSAKIFFKSIKNMTIKEKIVIIILFVLLIVTIFTCTYISLANDEFNEQVIAYEEIQVVEENIIRDDPELNIISGIIEDITPEEPITEEVTIEKEVTYNGKKVSVPKAKVAAANSKEDSQTQKTGGESVSAEEAVSKFENDGQSAGIDVSAHQGKIDWSQVKASGIEFAMIRCGFRGYESGIIYEDAYFKSNIDEAIKNGIKVGIYFYSVSKDEDEALQEAAWVVERIKSYRITYPVVYDFEDFYRGRTYGISKNQATANALTYLNYVANAGYQPMMYANKNDITNNFDKEKLSKYKFWLAHYTTATNYTGSYQMWQYTSSGSVPGISGRVDMNVAYFRYGAVAEPKHIHNFTDGTIINTNESKEPTCTEAGVKFIRCKDCSDNQRQDIPALGHQFGNFEIVKSPTENEYGLKVRECTVCHEKEEVQIDKLEPIKDDTPNNNTDSDDSNYDNTDTPIDDSTTSPEEDETISNEVSEPDTSNTNP